MKILVFQSTRHVILAERVVKESGAVYKIIPVPRSISSECGMAMGVDELLLDKIKALLDKQNIPVQIYESSQITI